MDCPCQSGKNYDLCCGHFISHRAVAENAQQLMRSRYTAHVLKKAQYLRETWHADYCPVELQIDDNIKWMSLEVLGGEHSAEKARVEFEAIFFTSGRIDALHENSRFVFIQGRWLYTEGEWLAPTRKIIQPGRNTSCPCGSGVKFKRCCWR